MATVNIIRCDRCGNEIRNSGGVNQLTAPSKGDYHPRKIDLCNSCYGQFNRFMENKDVGYNNTRFTTREGPCTHHIPCAGPCGETLIVRSTL